MGGCIGKITTRVSRFIVDCCGNDREVNFDSEVKKMYRFCGHVGSKFDGRIAAGEFNNCF